MNKAPFGMMWRPALAAPPSILQKQMGQPSPTQAPLPLIDSPELAAMTDFAASASSAFLAHALQKNNNSWSTLWWIVSAATGVKFLHDLSRF